MNPLAMSVSIASAVLAMKNNGGGKLSKFHAAWVRAKDAPCCFQKETARRYVVDEDTRKGNLLIRIECSLKSIFRNPLILSEKSVKDCAFQEELIHKGIHSNNLPRSIFFKHVECRFTDPKRPCHRLLFSLNYNELRNYSVHSSQLLYAP